ncbi:MAG TPA: putative entry exclusion protein TrbK-alt [Methylocella sp.]|nr:putative entry exclusion protein TrbK-alt [Methylocella sp.]
MLYIFAIGRGAGFAFVAAAIVATAVHSDYQKVEPEWTAVRPAASADPLAAELARCRALGMVAQDDASCKAIWAENRRRFFTYQSGDTKMPPRQPQASTPKIEDR